MVIEFKVNNLAARLSLMVLALAACALLVALIVARFVIGTLADDRFTFGRETLEVPVSYLPNSARLNARLAEAELRESGRDLERAEQCALRAVKLSPFDYRFQLTLASIKEASGD